MPESRLSDDECDQIAARLRTAVGEGRLTVVTLSGIVRDHHPGLPLLLLGHSRWFGAV